jgi:cytochrome c553
MIRTAIVLAFWAVLPSPGQVGPVALYTEFAHQPSPAVQNAIREEVDSLLAPDGLRFEWKSLPATDSSAWMDLAVVKFSGRCQVLPFATNSHLDGRLGWTHVSGGTVLPFAEVDCDAILAYILKDLLRLPAHSRETLLGRAIGRVTAHELLHVFAKTTAHSSHGVDHPVLSVEDLMADRLAFEELDPVAHILRTNPTAVAPADGGSAQAGRTVYAREGCSACHGLQGEGSRHGPLLHLARGALNSAMLAAKLTKSQDKMCQRARRLKVPLPSVGEDELPDLVRFLNEIDQ